MANLTPISLDDGTIIMIKATETNQPKTAENQEQGLSTRGANTSSNAMQQFTAMQGTIKAFAIYTLNSFKEISTANVDKVKLEFGINVGGEAGIPYITKGSVASNLKITVECSFPVEQ